MTEWTCAEARISLGVYVLGAIDPSERGLVDAHLATCRDCRDELAGLASLPALLARVTPEELERIEGEGGPADEEPPAELVGTVLDLAAARRRRSRWRYTAAAAAVVALAAGVFGGLASRGSAPAVAFSPGAGSWQQEQGADSVTGASAYIDYATERWGTVLAAEVDGIVENTTCELRIKFTDGTVVNAASWTTAADEGEVWYWGSVPAADEAGKQIASFQITNHGKLLLNVPV
jgi:putative zinc finger protein